MVLNKDQRILVIAAHPDDEVLGCGGTLAKAVKLGASIRVVFLGEGISARFPFGQYQSSEFDSQSKIRINEAKAALKVLNIKDVHFGDRLCVQFDTLPHITLVKDIEKHVNDFQPTILLTHNPSEVNIDHRLTYEAVEAACRPTGRKELPDEIYTFEIICSGSYKFLPFFSPNVFVDISDTWDIKVKAWECYEKESMDFPFPRSIEGLKTLAMYRGLASGIEKVEAFNLARMIVK
ncbi:PIG-L family deacetylase [Candidatus Woesearchaeota archaeon]|nr:PIG-L family deacetylase [Candidatus Woesearchaeota archaeon]